MKQAKRQLAGSGEALPAGAIGEVKRETRLRSAATSLTSGTSANLTANAITLSPGVYLISAGANLTGAATSVTRLDLGISTTSATLPSGDEIPWLRLYQNITAANLGSTDVGGHLPPYYLTVTAQTTYYAVISATFSGGTAFAGGYIQAVRIA